MSPFEDPAISPQVWGSNAVFWSRELIQTLSCNILQSLKCLRITPERPYFGQHQGSTIYFRIPLVNDPLFNWFNSWRCDGELFKTCWIWIFKHILQNSSLGTHCAITLRSMPQNLSDEMSTLVQKMVWWRQITSHYLSLIPRSMTSYGVTMPQWVKLVWSKIGRLIIVLQMFTHIWSHQLTDPIFPCLEALLASIAQHIEDRFHHSALWHGK